jgi:glycosyltransferase involved in cell wall biosynthesis
LSKIPVLLMVRSLDHGGCERDAAKIAIGLDRSRFEPHVAVFHQGGFRTPEVLAAGVNVVHVPVTSFGNLSTVRGARILGDYVRKHKIRLIHAFDVPTDLFAAPVARWYRVPRVITSQLSFRDMYPPRERAALRVTDWLSDAVVVNSQAVGKSLETEAKLSPQKIYLSYNGVNTEHFHPGPANRPDAFRDASVIVGSVCVMRSEKRMDWVLRSFAEVFEEDPRARLLFVGSGPEVEPLQKLRDSLGLTDVCMFVPGQAEVADWMRSLDIYINSSYSESFPNGLLEAMACGCCVIGSNVGGIPELVTHMHDGLIFDSQRPEELTAMVRMAVLDHGLRTRLREQAAMTAREQFSMKIALARTESLYLKVLGKLNGKAQETDV